MHSLLSVVSFAAWHFMLFLACVKFNLVMFIDDK